MDAKAQNARIFDDYQALTPLHSLDTSPTAVVPLNTPIQGFPVHVGALMRLNGMFLSSY
jgi:hypothetical protein